MKKRVLMIADADGHWTKRYIEHLLLPAGYEVVLFPIWENHGVFEAFYRENGITVYRDAHALPVVRHIPRLRMWARIWLNARDLAKLGGFDIIHNHYLSKRDLALGKRVRACFPAAKWICSFWGSDLLRATLGQRRQMKPYLQACSAVTIHSALQFEEVRRQYGKAVAEKTALVYFGQTVYGDIDRVREKNSKAECKAHFGINPEKKVVCVGYNASAAQHQPEVLQALGGLPAEVLQSMTVILQMTYGRSDAAYVQAVTDAAEKLPCETRVYTDFMDGTESAYLRLSADAFILAIQTDSFSASLQEYLYAGAKALVGDWLSYPQLEELGIETIGFSAFSQIPALLEAALKNPTLPEEQERRNRLSSLYSWEAVSEAWLHLYQ